MIDPVSRAVEPASFSFALDAVGLPIVFDCCSQFSKLDCVQILSCSKLELPLGHEVQRNWLSESENQ